MTSRYVTSVSLRRQQYITIIQTFFSVVQNVIVLILVHYQISKHSTIDEKTGYELVQR